LLGASAANAVLDNHDSISQMRGRFMEYMTAGGQKIATLATFHPAYLLRSAGQKAKAWTDFLRLQNKLDE
jgi:DNA polymerase